MTTPEIADTVDPHAGCSGIYALRDARDAFAARAVLARTAERTLDVQYYIWHPDISGTLLFHALHAAAGRGVRVRLLLDDNDTSGLDPMLAALDAHPNIEVRLFNPFKIRRPRWLGYLFDFQRLNRRMHNKSFTADGRVTIVGGRNVGDEYFGAGSSALLFADLDVMAIGPVAGDVTANFDRYWSSEVAVPLERVVRPAEQSSIDAIAAECARREGEPMAVAYREAIERSSFVHDALERQLALEWVTTCMVSDDPIKALGRAARKTLVSEKLKAIFGEPRQTVDIVSPYFVPGPAGVRSFRAWRRRGVRVRILTNALESTDVAVVHAGYAKRRRALLEAGVQLYELRRSAALAATRRTRVLGSSSASLHAKTFAIDGSRVFVGSYNFDPRSARLNTEMGLVMESTVLGRAIQNAFDDDIPRDAYEVVLTPGGRMQWIERKDGRRLVHDREPGATFARKAVVAIASRLPIEWLL